ncbi:MAG TPA: hypothetical protein VFJ30_18840, partial [Phycisphaerae bacterium]|nr:hypothetical protein [Phycisphaerae bacterium]
MHTKRLRVVLLAGWILAPGPAALGQAVNPWLTSDAPVSAGVAAPNTFSLEALHESAPFKGLSPKEVCLKLWDVYYDGRR